MDNYALFLNMAEKKNVHHPQQDIIYNQVNQATLEGSYDANRKGKVHAFNIDKFKELESYLAFFRTSMNSIFSEADNADNAIAEKRKFLFMLKLARMSMTREYKVDRNEFAMSAGLGLKSFSDVQSALINFHDRNGVKREYSDIKDTKLVYMSLGCGSAELLGQQREGESEAAVKNNENLPNYFDYYGFADFLYFSLDGILKKFIKEDIDLNIKKGDIYKFISILSTMIIRRTYNAYYSKFQCMDVSDVDLDYNDYRFDDSGDIVSIQMGDNVKGMKYYGMNREQIKKMIKMPKEEALFTYLNYDLNILKTILKNLHVFDIVKENEKGVGKKYFLADNEFPGDQIKEIKSKNVIDMFKDLVDRYDFSEKQIDDNSSSAKQVEEFFNKYLEDIFNKDLNKYIGIDDEKVFLSDFSEICEIFNHGNVFDIATAHRAESHARRAKFMRVAEDISRRLKPGGIYISDGFRESYTRESALDRVKNLVDSLGEEYKIDIIIDKKEKVRSFIIQRGLNNNGEISFLNADEKNSILANGCKIGDIYEYINDLFYKIRSLVVKQIKLYRRADVPEGLYEHYKVSLFKRLHDEIDEITNDIVTKLPESPTEDDINKTIQEVLYYSKDELLDLEDNILKNSLEEKDLFRNNKIQSRFKASEKIYSN